MKVAATNSEPPQCELEVTSSLFLDFFEFRAGQRSERKPRVHSAEFDARERTTPFHDSVAIAGERLAENSNGTDGAPLPRGECGSTYLQPCSWRSSRCRPEAWHCLYRDHR